MRVMNHTESKKPAGESMNTNNCWLAIDVTPCQAINCVVNNKSNGISRKNSAPLIKKKADKHFPTTMLETVQHEIEKVAHPVTKPSTTFRSIAA